MDIVGKQKNFIILLVACIGLISLVRTVLLLWNTELPDFGVYYHATSLYLGGNNPYINSFYTQFNYPPFTTLMISLLTAFPYELATKIWLLGSISALIYSLLVLQRVFQLSRLLLVGLFTLTTLAFPFKYTLGMGQINLFLLLSVSLFLYFFEKKHSLHASIALAVAVILKVVPLVFIYPLLLQKKWRMVAISVGITATLLLFSLIYNYEATTYFFTTVFPTLMQKTGGPVYYNQSLTGILARFSVSTPMILVTRYYLMLFAAYLIFRNKKDFIYTSILLLTTVLLLNNFTWQHHLVLLLIPYSYVLSKKKTWKEYVLLGVSYLLIAHNLPKPELHELTWYGKLYLSHGFIGMFILWTYLFTLGTRLGRVQKKRK